MIDVMDEQAHKFREFIGRVREKTGWSPTEIARRAGLASTTLTRAMSRGDEASSPTLRTINKIERVTGVGFDVDLDVVDLVQSDASPQASGRVTRVVPQTRLPLNLAEMPTDLPVYVLHAIVSPLDNATMEGFAMREEPVDYCRRPLGVAGMASAYATYAPTDALYKYDKGDFMVVAPDRPAVPGDIVLLTVRTPGDAPVTHIGRLERSDREWATLATDRPTPMRSDFAASTVVSIHKVLSLREALGA